MFEHEITIEVKETFEDLIKKLEQDGFKLVRKYYVIDTYMIPNYIDTSNMHTLDILSHAVIVRNINDEKIRLTFKEKKYNNLFEILEQDKLELKVNSEDDTILFFEKLNFNKVLTIHNDSYVYVNDLLEITIQNIKDDAIYIEMENKYRHSDKVYKDVDSMIKDLNTLNINYTINLLL